MTEITEINDLFYKIIMDSGLIFIIATTLSIIFASIEEKLKTNKTYNWIEEAAGKVSIAFRTVAYIGLTSAVIILINSYREAAHGVFKWNPIKNVL